MKIYFDGSARPNPGPMRTAVVAGGQTYHHAIPDAGDNNDAEWLALLEALRIARSLEITDATFLGDSIFVVQQAKGDATCRTPRFQARLAEFRTLATGFERIRIRHIGRAQNLAGIALERHYGRL